MEIVSQVTEKFFNDFLGSCSFPVTWAGNGSMGRDYFNKETGKMIATYSHGFVANEYFLIDYFDDPPPKTSYGIY